MFSNLEEVPVVLVGDGEPGCDEGWHVQHVLVGPPGVYSTVKYNTVQYCTVPGVRLPGELHVHSGGEVVALDAVAQGVEVVCPTFLPYLIVI